MLDLLAKWMPPDMSTHGAELDQMNALVHWLMAVMAVGWGLFFLYVLFRFRAKKNPQASYTGSTSHFSTWTEVAVVVVEVILLVGFGIPAWARWVTPHAAEENPVVVRVIGEQFAWNVHYPGADGVFGTGRPELVSVANPLGLEPDDPMGQDDIVSVNQLHLPVNRPITIQLGTKDVIHSFALPLMRVKQDAIPGQLIPVHFTAAKATPADAQFPKCAASKSCWEIACSQLCGLGHYRMRGFLIVHEEGGYEDWLAEKAPQEPADETAVEATEADQPG